ncbi:MFS general substrate transporter [Rhizodiscina lignyota]|uniref:MFS general substrate transporter n=1 Tax=Rhizodiscina lignyota TaxID=1504668 RepID=A0A9P4IK70_9PEZI|nr:MFS general substrate transporter [Rhizodiscina lignyota]
MEESQLTSDWRAVHVYLIAPDRAPLGAEGEYGEIVWHYLTFETELPAPSSFNASTADAPPPPDAPDLSKYINPFEWSPARKGAIIWLSCVATCFTAFTAGSYAPGIDQLTNYFHVSRVACLTGITAFTTGFGIAPMVLAPFSELNGRRPVFLATGMLFLICQLCCALTRSFGGMLAARFFVGVGGSTFSTLVGGCVSDIYHKHDRNTPMALFSGAALFGTGLGPLCAGFIARSTTWRWIFWMQVIMDGALMLVMTFLFQETRGSVLLSRKAKKLNKWYEEREKAGYYGFDMLVGNGVGEKRVSQRVRWKVKSDEERGSIAQMISISLYRPFHLLLTEPVVFFFSLWVSFSWAVLYLFFSAVTLVFTTNHHFDVAQAGATFASICVGSLIATLYSTYQEEAAIRGHWGDKFNRTFPKLPLKLDFTCPEGRLYFSSAQSLFLPIGMFMFAWTNQSSVPWIVPCIAVSIATMGIFSIYLATFNYLADTYHRYASSALAAQSFCRNVLGGAAPLFTVQMYDAMGYGGASSFLGGVAILLSFVPWILTLYGPQIRARSRFASEIMTKPSGREIEVPVEVVPE